MIKKVLLTFTILTACLFATVHGTLNNQPQGPSIDLKRFTVGGVGLLSSAEDVVQAFGHPEEEESISIPEEEEKRLAKEPPIEKREPEGWFDKVVYAYFEKGIKITFREEDMSVFSIELFPSALPPYEKFLGAFVQPLPLEVREVQLLRPFVKQIYRDEKNVLYLKKDDRSPLRETAILNFTVEGWLKKITFKWAENHDIDIDNFCIAGICLGDTIEKAMDRLGPPDSYSARKKRYVGKWNREGLMLYARKKSRKIYRIVITLNKFDGGFAQPLTLSHRKKAFHDYLDGRIYQEASNKICAYKKGEPLSEEKVILKFDEDDRLNYLFLDTISNIKLDYKKLSVGALRIGDSPKRLRKFMGPFSKCRRLKDGIALAYPRYGTRVSVEKIGEDKEERKTGEEEEEPRVKWSEIGNIKKIVVTISRCSGLYSIPVSLAKDMDAYEELAKELIFRRKEHALYMSQDGLTPESGTVVVVDFEKAGWPRYITLKRFRNIVVDMKAFTVAGISLGTHADEVLRILGKPDRVNVLKKQNLTVFVYSDEGLMIVIDRMDRSVCKINIDMESFEGEFVQDLTLDSSADDYEKIFYKQIYRQDEKRLFLTRDGKKPTWEEAVVYFSLAGTINKISFQTLAVKKEGILIDITHALE